MNKILQALENSTLLTSKTCCRCKQEKDLDSFRKSKGGTLGRSCYCKLCQNAVNKDLYWLNKEKRLKQVKQWNSEHPELVAWNKEKYNEGRKKNKDS